LLPGSSDKVESGRSSRARPEPNVGLVKSVTDRIGKIEGFPGRLREFRKARQLSVDALAKSLDVQAYTIRRWETGSSRPSRELADKLSDLGFGPVQDEDTNIGSRSRRREKASAIPLFEHSKGKQVPGLPNASFPVWVANGPADQESFYERLIGLQVKKPIDPRRLSIIDEYEQGRRTAQAELEAPKLTSASWNSNYGSHGWHRYVGRFPPHLVRSLLNHFGADRSSTVCDPFSGSGTTAVECRLLGIPFVGIEIGALSHLIGKVKAGFSADPTISRDLSARYELFMRYFEADFKSQRKHNFTVQDVLNRDGNRVPEFANIEKWFTPTAFLGVSLTVEFATSLPEYEHDLTIFALSAKMRSIGNLDVDVVRAEYSRKPRENVDVCGLVARHLRKMGSDVQRMLSTHSDLIGDPSTVRLIEGSALSAEIKAKSVRYIITSPPYGVEALSYLRTHLLSYRSLASELNHDPYETRSQTVGSEYLEESSLPIKLEVEQVSPTFTTFFQGQNENADKKSRQRRVGMMRFFEDVHAIGARMSEWLEDGGRVAWVIGNKRLGDAVIPTDRIVEESFASHGLKLYDVIRHKLKTNNSNSQVPWQERVIQEEAVMLFERVKR